jgi:N-methylhydantoinase B/oxoprolinase/acetone carboxylase alpha subunit
MTTSEHAVRPDAWLLEEYAHLDAVTFRVVGSALVSACREMGVTMMRTAYSPIFVDGMDFSCGILDAQGEMVAQGEFCPVHLNSMAYSAQWALLERGAEHVRPGDVLIHNDPYRGGTHLNDFNVMKPVFVDDELVAIACNRAHQIDMGGKARAGFAGDATEVFQEGIRVPPVKWYDGGVEVVDVLDFLLANVRQPQIQRGDLSAQLASCVTAERRIVELCRRYGTNTVLDCFAASKDYSERLVRASIATLPDGTWSFGDRMDNDGIDADPIAIEVDLTIDHDSVTVDFSRSGPQVKGPVNATYGITASMVFTALLQVCEPGIPANHGCFRPLRIVAPRGSVTNAQFPAPTMGGNTVTSMAIYGTVLGAFAQAAPNRVAACSYSSHHFTGGGRVADTDWLFYFFTDGGWGARAGGDGWNAIFQANGNCKDYPVEVIETTLPLRYEAVRLRADLAGPGRFRGGAGTERVLTFLQPGEANSICERGDFRPYGLFGGKAGGTNALLLHAEGELVDFGAAKGARFPLKFANRPVAAGETISIVTTGGGGYGPPEERDPEAVLEDVRDGLYDASEARRLYAVVVRAAEGDWELDVGATSQLRRESSAASELADRGRPWPDAASGTTEEGRAAAERLRQLRARRPDAFCVGECPRQGLPYRCPLWNAEAIEYWTPANIGRWIERHCPRADAFAGVLSSVRIYS